MGKILFVGHDATRTGAPFVLLHLLRWLKANTNVGFHLLLLRGGELEPEFAEVSRVSVLASGKDNIIRKALRHYGIHRDGSYRHLSLLKIGRASCRDRVAVEVSGRWRVKQT